MSPDQMRPDLMVIIDGISARLRSINGLRVFTYLPDSIAPPTAIIELPSAIDFDQTWGRGEDRYTVPLLVVVGLGSDRASYRNLAAHMSAAGPSSIKLVMSSDSTLGGIVNDAVVSRAYGVGRFTFSGTDYLGCRFDIVISA